MYAGGVNVPLSMKLTPSEVVFRVNHSEARFLMVSDYYLQVVRQVEGELKTVEKVFVLRRDGSLDGKYISFGELQEAGRQVHPEEVMLRAREVGADDLANISYTSGTTAEPKGIMLTHGNYCRGTTVSRIRWGFIPLCITGLRWRRWISGSRLWNICGIFPRT